VTGELDIDLAEAAIEDGDMNSDTSAFAEQPIDLIEPTDLAITEAGANDIAAPEDLGAPTSERNVEEVDDTKNSIDLAQTIVDEDLTADSPGVSYESDMLEQSYADPASDRARLGELAVEAEDLGDSSPNSEITARQLDAVDFGQTKREPSVISESKSADDVLTDNVTEQEVIADQNEDPLTNAAKTVTLPDQTDTVDLRNAPDNKALVTALAERGLELEAVEKFDFSDNPIQEYRESGPAEDIGYAVTAWNDQIAPSIATGATREHFEAYDQQHGLEGHQRLAGVYDYFLGNDAIKSGGEREDGTLDVTGGRHRLEQARLKGVAYLPVRK
jgi:hypothetical protein